MVYICIQQYKTSVNILSGNGPAVFVQLPVLQKCGYATQANIKDTRREVF